MALTEKEEEKRIREVYAHRDASGKHKLYAWFKPDALLNHFRFRATAASMLISCGLTDLSQLDILDVGCGTGTWLRNLLEWGAVAERLHGIDLLDDRIRRAAALSPGIDFQPASGYRIPYSSASMDLVSAHTVFSSILDPEMRTALASEMLRVRRPNGKILIYDYRVSDPRNPDTIGIRKAEIQRLFPGAPLRLESVTLAPPIARAVAPLSFLLAHMMEAWLPFLRTHAFYLVE